MNGYPFVFSSMLLGISDKDNNWKYFNSTLVDQNTYYFDSNYNAYVSNLSFSSVGDEGFVIPVNLDVYDYYLVGTLAFTNTVYTDFNGLSHGFFYGDDGLNNHYSRFDIKTVPFFNDSVNGQSFYCKLDLFDNCNVNSITFSMESNSYLWGDVWFCASIVPVEKTAGSDAATAAIIQKLTEINTNQTNSNVLQQESNQIAQDTQNQIIQGNEIAQDQLEVEQEQAETQKSLLDRVTDFFSNFFENLKNFFIGLIVPSEEEMAELFNELNDFFSEKFGFLYYPFDFIIRAFGVLMGEGSGTTMTFPSFSMMGYEIWPDIQFDIAENEVANQIFGYVRLINGSVLSLGFINYLRDFFEKRFGGGGR